MRKFWHFEHLLTAGRLECSGGVSEIVYVILSDCKIGNEGGKIFKIVSRVEFEVLI